MLVAQAQHEGMTIVTADEQMRGQLPGRMQLLYSASADYIRRIHLMTAGEAIKPKLNPGKLFINGRHEDAAGGKTIDVMNPATGELLTTVPDGDARDIDRAVAAARTSFEKKSWRGMDPSKKEKILWDVAELLVKHKEELSVLESMENGKTVREAAGADVGPEIGLF